MSIPTHGPTCQTWMYPVDCRDCGRPIHVLQCTCGSAVLFDFPRPPWDYHECGGGVGGSGLSGWAAVDVLRNRGIAITPDIMEKIFENEGGKVSHPSRNDNIETEKINPTGSEKTDFIGVVREYFSKTNRLTQLGELSEMGRQILGLPEDRHLRQFTIIDNGGFQHKSYTCVAPSGAIHGKIAEGMIVKASIEARSADEYSVWVATSIEPL